MKKLISLTVATLLLSLNFSLFLPTVLAQEETETDTGDADRERIERQTESVPRSIIPKISNPNITGNYVCTVIIKRFEENYFFELDSDGDEQGSIDRFNEAVYLTEQAGIVDGTLAANDILGCALMTGRVKLAYLRLLVFYVLRLVTVISGTVSMIFIIVGGYKYIIGAITENKDEGKKTIIAAITGLVVSTLAWSIVNIVQTFVTS